MTDTLANCPVYPPDKCTIGSYPPFSNDHTLCENFAAEEEMYAHVRVVFDDLFRTMRVNYPHIWETGDGYGGGVVRLLQEAAEKHGFYAQISRPAFTQRRVIKDIVERDGHQCTYCDKTLNTILDRALNPTVDHIVPRSRGGTDDLGNLVLACKSCNSSKGARSVTEWSTQR